MPASRFPYGRTFLLAFGFFGISLIWPIFNNFVPIFLREMGLSAAMVGFVMTWDNYLNMFVQPTVGAASDRTWTRIGRRKPWIVIGAPLAALAFVFVPLQHAVVGMMMAILITNVGMALFRAPTVALLGDLFPPEQRSTANGVINFMGGVGAIVAFVGGGYLYEHLGRPAPFFFGSLILLIAVALVVLFIREPRQPLSPATTDAPQPGTLSTLKALMQREDPSGIFVLLAILAWFMGYNALETWISSFGKYVLGVPEGRMAIYTALLALTFVVTAIPAGLLGERLGRRRIILWGVGGLTLALIYGTQIRSVAMLLPFLVLAGFFWALINVNSLPLVYDVSGAEAIGAFTGLYYLASNVAAVAGPQVVGFLIDWSGGHYRVMFPFAVAFMLLAAWFMGKVHPQGAKP